MQQRPTSLLDGPFRVRFAVFVLLAFVSAACGSGVDGTPRAANQPAVDSATPEPTEIEDRLADTGEEVGVAPAEFIEPLGSFSLAALGGPVQDTASFASPAMGGIRFDYPVGWVPSSNGERAFVSLRADGTTVALAEIMLVSGTIGAEPVQTVEDFLAAFSRMFVRHAPVNEQLTVLGTTLSGHNIHASGLDKTFSFNRHPAPTNAAHGVGEGEFNRSFLGTTPSGVLWANAWGRDAASIAEAGRALLTMAQSAEFTGPGLDPPLPAGRAVAFPVEGLPPEADRSSAGDVPLLDTPFFDPPAGSYALSNTGRNAIIDIDEETIVQPNFPGFVVLADEENFSPGFDVLAFFTGVIAVVPATGGPTFNEAAILEVDGFDDFLDNVPAGVNVTEVNRGLVLAGLRAASFELSANPDADCSLEDACLLHFLTPYASAEIFVGMRNKFWWIEDYIGDEDLLVRGASLYPDADWIRRADDIMASMRLVE